MSLSQDSTQSDMTMTTEDVYRSYGAKVAAEDDQSIMDWPYADDYERDVAEYTQSGIVALFCEEDYNDFAAGIPFTTSSEEEEEISADDEEFLYGLPYDPSALEADKISVLKYVLTQILSKTWKLKDALDDHVNTLGRLVGTFSWLDEDVSASVETQKAELQSIFQRRSLSQSPSTELFALELTFVEMMFKFHTFSRYEKMVVQLIEDLKATAPKAIVTKQTPSSNKRSWDEAELTEQYEGDEKRPRLWP